MTAVDKTESAGHDGDGADRRKLVDGESNGDGLSTKTITKTRRID